MQRDLILPILILALLFAIIPAASGAADPDGSAPSGGIVTFIPRQSSIHSDQVTDMIDGLDGEVIFATSYGLSFFNGSWTTWHHNPAIQNVSHTPLQDTVLSVEYDYLDRLWIGYGGGIQVWNGRFFIPVRDLQLLKDLQIRELQRWNDTMWVATGHSGIHRYQDTGWTWFQPFGPGGARFYQVNGMVLDAETSSLLIASDREGPWAVRGDPSDVVWFVGLTDPSTQYYSLNHVKRDPLGGAYFFDETTVAHYRAGEGFRTVLTSPDLAHPPPTINDVEASADGTLYIATNQGIYLWHDWKVVDRVHGFVAVSAESDIISSLFLDASGRLWFSGHGVVGYYFPDRTQQPAIAIRSPGATTTEAATTEATTTGATITPGEQVTGTVYQTVLPQTTVAPSPQQGSIADSILRFLDDMRDRIAGLFTPGNKTSA